MLTITKFKEKYNVHITTDHNDKMAGLASISTSPLCNALCKERTNNPNMVCAHCYSMTMNTRFKNLRKCLENNSNVLPEIEIPADDLPRLFSETGYFRFEAFGDLMNETQVKNYFAMAAANSHMACALWTKNPWFIENAMKKYGIEKPANLTIIGSSYYVNVPMVEFYKRYDFIDYVFTVYDDKFIQENGIEINCGGRSCAECGKCYTRSHSNYEINEKLK